MAVHCYWRFLLECIDLLCNVNLFSAKQKICSVHFLISVKFHAEIECTISISALIAGRYQTRSLIFCVLPGDIAVCIKCIKVFEMLSVIPLNNAEFD